MKVLALLLIFISCQSNAGAATVTLTSTLDGSQTACPEEVVTYTCMVLRTSVASWHGLPDSIELDYFPSSPIGQQSVIGAFRATLTNRVLDPNNPFLADLTLTLIVTATAGRNGTVIECRGDEPSERMSLVLSVASLPPSPPQNPGYHVQHYGPHNVTVTVQWGYPEFDGGVPVDNYTISGTNIMTTTSQINETTLTLPYNVNQTIDVAATNCIGTNGTAMFTYFEAGCGEPTPPSRGFIDNFQSAAEGATITYSCSSGLVPGTQISAVCTNVTWKPDPSTLECREPISGELGKGSGQCVSREELRAEINTLRDELNSWLNTTISSLKIYLIDQGNGQCACTTEIKQLLGKMDRVQNSVAANNASNQKNITLQQQLLQYIQEQNRTLQEITNRLPQNSSQHFLNGTFQNPAPSCKYIKQGSPSGYYWIQRHTTGYACQVYCNMTRQCCGRTDVWMRVADLNMSNPNHHCPHGFKTITSPKRMCGRQNGPGCVSTIFSVHGIQYQNVCGRAIGYQDNSPNAFGPYYNNRHITIDSTYIDGVSITHGHNPRKHIWSFAAALDEIGTHFPTTRCPCTKTNAPFPGVIPPFVGQDYFCDTGSRSTYQDRIYSNDPLWDGHGCGVGSSCCKFNSPPWFCKQLPQSTSDDIELRLCSDQNIENEDVLIELVELYVQ